MYVNDIEKSKTSSSINNIQHYEHFLITLIKHAKWYTLNNICATMSLSDV